MGGIGTLFMSRVHAVVVGDAVECRRDPAVADTIALPLQGRGAGWW